MGSILIENGFVVTMDQQRRTIEKGAVAIEDDRIVAVGKTSELRTRFKSQTTIDASSAAILPGFVNTHTHLYQTLLRSLGDDLKLMQWLPTVIHSASGHFCGEDSYCGAIVGCLELIKSGCTCTVDMGIPSTDQNVTDQCIQALIDIGIRAIEAKATRDANVLNIFSSSGLQDTEEAVKSCVHTIERWHGSDNGRVLVWPGPGSVMSCSESFLTEASKIATEYGLGISIHLHETREEVAAWKERFRATPIMYLRDLGFLGSNVLAVHCVWVNKTDIKILREADVKVSHNPVSNMYLASGVAPIPQMLKEGIVVGLGVDGAASNNSQDMFEVIKTAVLLHKVNTLDPLAMTAEKALEMATINGAKALGLQKEIGCLEPGKKADIVIVDLRQANIVPLNRLTSQLVYCAKSSNVRTVIIDGRIVMENHEIKTLNEQEALDKAQKRADCLVRKAGIAHLRRRKDLCD